MPAPAQHPLVLAMVLCDQFYREPASGKLSVLGCFNAVAAPVFPAKHPDIGVLVTITDTAGPVTIRAQLVDANEDAAPLATSEVTALVRDPRHVGDYLFHLRGVVFPAPKEYRVQAFCNNEFLMERRLLVRLGGRPGAG